MSKLASVKYGTVELPSGKTIEVGFRQWFEWLENPETKSFRVDDGEGYTARKETANGYWYAYRKVEGKLHKRYIGISKALTMRRLAEVGGLFDIPSTPKSPKLHKLVGNLVGNSVGNSVGNNPELHNELGNLRAENLKLHNQVTQLTAELTKVRSQLSENLDWPDAADLLNQLKAKRKKSKTDLQDVEAILEMLEQAG